MVKRFRAGFAAWAPVLVWVGVVAAAATCVGGCGPGGTGATAFSPEIVSEPTLRPGDPVPPPTEKTVLTLAGRIGTTNHDTQLRFDLPTLERLGVVRFRETNPFTGKTHRYAGVPLGRVLDVAQPSTGVVSARLAALDDYETTSTLEELCTWPLLIATQIDEAPIRVADGGPLTIVVPYGYFPDISRERLAILWVWSLNLVELP